VVYTVVLIDPADDDDADVNLLREMARTTGGRMFAPRTAAELPDVFAQIAADIRDTYTIGYVSTSTLRDGAFRRIQIGVNAPSRRVTVRTRPGYLANP
jgi:VWFA-related protein